MITDAWNQWLTSSAQLDQFAAAIASARRAYDGALQQERAGMRTTLDVLDLARELLNARNSYNTATADAYVARVQLLATMGSLELRRLLPNAPAHDPSAHFDKVRDKGDFPVLTPLAKVLDGGVGKAPRNRLSRELGALAVSGGNVSLTMPNSEQSDAVQD